MSVHPQSVVSTIIKDFNEELYNKLTAMESVNYNSPNTGSISDHKNVWTEYSGAWLAYFNKIKLSEVESRDLVFGLFGFMTVHMGFGKGSVSTLDKSDGFKVFDGGGVIEQVLTYPDDYYNDLVIPAPPLPPATGPAEDPYSPRMKNDIPKVEGAGDTDRGKFRHLVETEYPNAVGEHCMDAAFSDPTPPETTLSKTEMWDLIFITMGWKAIFEIMGTDSVIPERP